MANGEKSLIWIVAAAGLFVAVLGWGFLAGSYAGAHSTALSEMSEEEVEALEQDHNPGSRRGAVSAFVGNSIEQLPNLPSVVSWHFSNRIWLPILIALAMLGVVGGGFALKKVEQSLQSPASKRRR